MTKNITITIIDSAGKEVGRGYVGGVLREQLEEPRKEVPTCPMLTNVNTVCIRVPQHVVNQRSADVAFYVRLKAASGCTSKLNLEKDVMCLYIEPNSEAALMFVARMLARHRALNTACLPPDLVAQAQKLLPETA